MGKQTVSKGLITFAILLCTRITFGQELRPQYEPPNLYEFVGRNVAIAYSTNSFLGEPLLSYKTPNKTRGFRGEDIRVLHSEIGQLVTVTLDQFPDLKTVTLTLIIPDINLPTGEAVTFKTRAVFSTQLTSIAGPQLIAGVLQNNRFKSLLGKASRVDFLHKPDPVIIGEVRLSPTCPGPQRPGQICTGPFAGADVQLFDQYGNFFKKTQTNNEGLFELSAKPGEYTVRINILEILPRCPDTRVNVPKNGRVPVAIDCDTGIR